MNRTRLLGTAVALALAGLQLTGCGGSDATSQQPPSAAPSPTSPSPAPAPVTPSPTAPAPAPAPTVPSPSGADMRASFLLRADDASQGLGRVTLDKLASGAVRVSARIHGADARANYVLALREAGAGTNLLEVPIDGVTASGQGSLAADRAAARTYEQLLAGQLTARVTSSDGRTTLMQGAVGAGATRLIDELTIDGIQNHVARHGIRDVKALLAAMPPTMRANYTLVETSDSLQPATLGAPRIVMVGADARLLVGVNSTPGSASREIVELAELLADGTWKFRQLDLRTLASSGASCSACHGQNPRPIWKEYNQWPGVFGANGDALTSGQVETLQQLRQGQAASDRFHALAIGNHGYGTSFYLPFRAYGYTNFNITVEVSRATAEGVWKRIRSHADYARLRDGFFLQTCDGNVRTAANPAWARFTAALRAAGQAETSDLAILKALGVADPVAELQISKRADRFLPGDGIGYNISATGLFDLVLLMVLDDIVKAEPALAQKLAALPDEPRGYPASGGGTHSGRYGLGKASLEEARRYRVEHLFELAGEALQRSREHHTATEYADHLWRVSQGLLTPARASVCSHLASR